MNTTTIAQQLRLAADIEEKGHDWEICVSGTWRHPGWLSALGSVLAGHEIRIKPPVFPEPPPGEAWHNPDNLTPEQVGVKDGWRLALVSEVRDDSPLSGKFVAWFDQEWDQSYHWAGNCVSITYRTREPLPIWKLGRSVNGFTLGEGQEWHRQDFTKEMLPDGWRPVLRGETIAAGDEYSEHGDPWFPFTSCIGEVSNHGLYERQRTRRPLPPVIPAGFTPWNGGECPVDGNEKVEVIYRDGGKPHTNMAKFWSWQHKYEQSNIIAYRSLAERWSHADHVPLNCWLRHKHESQKHFAMLIIEIRDDGVEVKNGKKTWKDLEEYLHSTDRKTWKECVK